MYLIADLLTTTRLILIFVLAHFIKIQVELLSAFTVFCVGEFTDALDGFFAKKFPYPDDGKFRPWREGMFPKIYDTGTDMILALTYAVYFYKFVDSQFVVFILTPAFTLGFFVEYLRRTPEFREADAATLKLIDARRLLYGVALFVVFGYSIFKLSVANDVKFILEVLLGVVGVFVLIFKGNRLREK